MPRYVPNTVNTILKTVIQSVALSITTFIGPASMESALLHRTLPSKKCQFIRSAMYSYMNTEAIAINIPVANTRQYI